MRVTGVHQDLESRCSCVFFFFCLNGQIQILRVMRGRGREMMPLQITSSVQRRQKSRRLCRLVADVVRNVTDTQAEIFSRRSPPVQGTLRFPPFINSGYFPRFLGRIFKMCPIYFAVCLFIREREREGEACVPYGQALFDHA